MKLLTNNSLVFTQIFPSPYPQNAIKLIITKIYITYFGYEILIVYNDVTIYLLLEVILAHSYTYIQKPCS